MIEIKNRYVPLLILSYALIAIFVGGSFLYFFLYLATLLYLIPLVWLLYSMKQLSGSIDVSAKRAEVGSSLLVKYTIRNSASGRFPYIELTNVVGSSFQEASSEKIVNLDANDSAAFEKEVTCTRRGKYSLQEFLVKSGDPFGLYKLSKALAAGEDIIVYPKIIFPAGVYPSARQHFGDLVVREKYFENISLLSDLRKWVPGDSLKKVHWKQSARQDKIIIKNYEKKGDALPKIFIDMSRKSYLDDKEHCLEDQAVSIAASLIYFFLSNRVAVEVISEYFREGSIKGRNQGDFIAIMDELITFSPTGNTVFYQYLNNYCRFTPGTGTLYVLSPQLTLQDASILLYLKQKGHIIILYYLVKEAPDSSTAGILEQLRDSSISFKVIRTES